MSWVEIPRRRARDKDLRHRFIERVLFRKKKKSLREWREQDRDEGRA